MKFKGLTVVMVLAMAVAFANCGDPTDTHVELAQQGRPIINGLPPDQPMHNAVVSLHQTDGTYWWPSIFCSGTLIAPDVVLTAAHCLDVGSRKRVVTMPPQDLLIFVGDAPVVWADGGGAPSDELHDVVETLIHPNYNKTSMVNDLGLIRLAVPSAATPVPALPASQGFTTGDEDSLTLNFAGFGDDEYGNSSVKLQLGGVLDSIESSSQIYYLQQAGGPCFGDSGGPAFVKRGGTAYVGGMTSVGDQYCAYWGISTRADAYEGWINDFVGTQSSFCGDDTCDANEDCATCAADCGACAPYCGDGTCGTGEDCASCSADCGDCPSVCGNGSCEADEDCNSCELDCGACPSCSARGVACTSGSECCSGQCHPKKHTCK